MESGSSQTPADYTYVTLAALLFQIFSGRDLEDTDETPLHLIKDKLKSRVQARVLDKRFGAGCTEALGMLMAFQGRRYMRLEDRLREESRDLAKVVSKLLDCQQDSEGTMSQIDISQAGKGHSR